MDTKIIIASVTKSQRNVQRMIEAAQRAEIDEAKRKAEMEKRERERQERKRKRRLAEARKRAEEENIRNVTYPRYAFIRPLFLSLQLFIRQ